MKKLIFLLNFLLFCSCFVAFSATNNNSSTARPTNLSIKHLQHFQKAYKDIIFQHSYDIEKDDFKIQVSIPQSQNYKTATFYWAGGRMLPEAELKNINLYWPLLYNYQKNLKDPANFTEEEKKRISDFGSDENRKNGAGTPMFFFDFIYDAQNKASLEKNIVTISFLGKNSRVHKRLKPILAKIENEILQIAENSSEIKDFIRSINSADAYFWRIISGTNRKSFHSYGIALDILPKNLGGKQIYWSWAKEIYPKTWMLIPLKERWMPPQSVIDIFENFGFIWGGKWTIFDNMHFEYHPEIIDFNFGLVDAEN